MSTLTADSPPVTLSARATLPEPGEVAGATPAALPTAAHVVLLKNIPWEAYEALTDADPSRSAPRIAYNNGTLEIMSPLRHHDEDNHFLALIIDVISLEWQLNMTNIGSTTLKRSDLLKGLEPDSCYYIQSYEAIFGRKTLDLEGGDPPPDLVIEMDLTHPSLDKMPIFAALGVPEVWIATANGITFLALQNGRYEEREESVALPPLTRTVVEGFLVQSLTVRRAAWMRSVQAWARENRPATDDTSGDGGTITP